MELKRIVNQNTELSQASIMHDALKMHLGDYVDFYHKHNSNIEYRKSLALVKEIVSPKSNEGNYNQFVLREQINRVSKSYSVCKEIIENNKVALKSPEFSKKYAVKNGFDVSLMETLSDKLGVNEFCHKQVYKDLFEAPNNIVVIWYDEKKQSSFYIVDIKDVIELKKEQQKIVELVYKGSDGEVIKINNKSRAVTDSDDKIKREADHGLGYCPAIQISNTPFGDGDLVTSIFYSVINVLTELWFWSNTGETSSLFAAHPYIWYLKPEKTPDKNNPYAGNQQFDDVGFDAQKVENNSETAKTDLSQGSPTAIAVTPNKDGELTKPIDRLDPDVDSLEFLERKPVTMAQKLIISLSGVIDSSTKSQINEKQIAAIKEVRNGILNGIARDVERIHRFIELTIQKENFGNDLLKVAVSYGNKFDILNEENLLDIVSSSASSKELKKKAISDVIKFKAKGNKDILKTESVKMLLTPYYLTDQSLLDSWVSSGVISYDDWYLGTNLDYLLNMFERYKYPISLYDDGGTSIETIVNDVKNYILKLIPKQNVI